MAGDGKDNHTIMIHCGEYAEQRKKELSQYFHYLEVQMYVRILTFPVPEPLVGDWASVAASRALEFDRLILVSLHALGRLLVYHNHWNCSGGATSTTNNACTLKVVYFQIFQLTM